MMLRAADFEGAWQLTRQIDDRLAGQVAEMDGKAGFKLDVPDALTYVETGQLRIAGGPPFEARRRYVWSFVDDRVFVTFDDGAPFHSFAPKGKGVGTDHPCGDDFYRVTYDFTAWPTWRATWDVRGPRKDYTSVSVYMRPDCANGLAQSAGNGQ